jgi:hypothetical protein
VFTKIPLPCELAEVPHAQQQHHSMGSAKAKEKQAMQHMAWVKRVEKGIHKIVEGPRRIKMNEKSKHDLLLCLELMGCKDTLQFDWKLELYTNPPALRSPRIDNDDVGLLEGDSREEVNTDEEQEEDGIPRPNWTRKEVHIIAVEAHPYWAMARHQRKQNQGKKRIR